MSRTHTRLLFAALTATTQVFNRDIQIANHKCKYILASALLDTQCQRGNWISRRLVERLGRQHEISQDYNPPDVLDANGHPVVACGIISLQWKWSPRGTRVHECSFLVFSESDHLDVIFGAEYLESKGLVFVNESAMTPMTAHNKTTTGKPDRQHITIFLMHGLTSKQPRKPQSPRRTRSKSKEKLR